MKILIILAVAVLLIIAAILYFGSGELDTTPKARPHSASAQAANDGPKQDFHQITGLLQQDMTNIPAALDAPRVAPNSAFGVKARLGDSPARQEYQVLVRVCELIIYADQEHSVRQRLDLEEQQKVTGNLMASDAANQPGIASARAALHARAQADWEIYRRQTDGEVARLLASLQNAKL